MIVTPTELVPAAELGRVHFVGIGGAGMSGIARIMATRGIPVSGSDAKESDVVLGLRALGAQVYIGHDAAHVDAVDTVVVSSAIRETNPELVAAHEAGLRVIPRASALASVMVGHRGVAVAGTHGKTTTASMITVALQHSGVDPSFAMGGSLNESGANAHDGTGDIFVAEADESDRSFLAYDPEISVVTNVEADHLDNYGTEDAYMAAFDAFADRASGVLVVCADDPGSAAVGQRVAERGARVRTYGESADADVRLTDLDLTGTGASFSVVIDGRRVGRVDLPLPGRHNALNAAAAFTVGSELGVPSRLLLEGLDAFTGTRRRFELAGVAGGVRVYDDYAHHPTEVAAVLAAARPVAAPGRVIAVFQPHLFSRTRIFAHDFGAALGSADEVVVMDIFAAREDPEPGVTGAMVAAAVPLPAEQVHFESSWSAVPRLVASIAEPGDVVLTIGAGDVTLIGPEVLEAVVGNGSAAT